MKNVLFVATVVQKHINVFHLPFLGQFQKDGYRTYVAAANDTEKDDVEIKNCDEYVEIDFKRNPLHPGNIKAYLKLKKLIDKEQFDIIHCHTPVGGLLGRLAARKARKKGTKVLYTAHGFHFYKGAPLKNWLMYYPVEKFCSRFTDTLITINREDYSLAKKKMKAKRIEYVPGVGIDLSRFDNVQVDRTAKRKEIGVPEDAFLLASVGEISVRKNHQIIVKTMKEIHNEKIHYAIVGNGALLPKMKDFVEECGLSDRVHFLGYRGDIPEIYKVADVCCLPSIHEGLPVALMEGMATGLPCITSRIRGSTDLIGSDSGFLVDPQDTDGFAKAITALMNDHLLCKKMGEINKERARQYSVNTIVQTMKSIYES